MFRICSPLIDDLQVVTEAVDLVLGFGEFLEQWIDLPEAAQLETSPDDPQGSFKGSSLAYGN